jgi:hypothetical protein
MRQGERLTEKTRREMGHRRAVWSLLRQYFDDLIERFKPGSHELIEKMDTQQSEPDVGTPERLPS